VRTQEQLARNINFVAWKAIITGFLCQVVQSSSSPGLLDATRERSFLSPLDRTPMSRAHNASSNTSRCKLSAFKSVILALTASGILITTSPVSGVIALEDRARFQCIGCHTGNAKEFTDPLTGERKETLMDITRKRSADHASIACQKCHVEGFDTFPHSGKKILGCMDCHPREGKGAHEDEPYHFGRIKREFKRTVHFTEHRKKFGCVECHHPHYFEATAHLGPPRAILAHHNDMCLNCHAADPEGQLDTIGDRLIDAAKPNLVAVHASIPHTTLHLRNTRCYDCHSGIEHVVSHALPLGDDAPGCESCHTSDSVHARLYRYVEKVSRTASFTYPAMARDTYVMGATRYIPLEIVAYSLVSGVLILVVAHAAMRFARRKPRRGKDA
jgi:predicted nucleic-acid-binding Zn-ribbon protein